MMKHHRVTHLRSLGGSAALVSLFVAGLGASAPVAAQDEKEIREERRIIIHEVGKEGSKHIGRRELGERLEECPEAQRLMSDVSLGEKPESYRTRIVICSKNGEEPTPEMRERLVAALERARGEVAENERLSPEGRTKALESLREEIERVRGEDD